MFNPETFELQQIVEEMIYPSLDRQQLGDVLLFFASRSYNKTYKTIASQTPLPESAISRRVARVQDHLLKVWGDAVQ